MGDFLSPPPDKTAHAPYDVALATSETAYGKRVKPPRSQARSLTFRGTNVAKALYK